MMTLVSCTRSLATKVQACQNILPKIRNATGTFLIVSSVQSTRLVDPVGILYSLNPPVAISILAASRRVGARKTFNSRFYEHAYSSVWLGESTTSTVKLEPNLFDDATCKRICKVNFQFLQSAVRLCVYPFGVIFGTPAWENTDQKPKWKGHSMPKIHLWICLNLNTWKCWSYLL